MFTAAAQALAEQVTAADLLSGALYPPITALREVTVTIAAAVAEAAVAEGVADEPDGDIEDVVADWVWDPQYPALEAD